MIVIGVESCSVASRTGEMVVPRNGGLLDIREKSRNKGVEEKAEWTGTESNEMK